MNLSDDELTALHRACFRAHSELPGANAKKLYDALVRALEELMFRRSKDGKESNEIHSAS